MKSTVAIGLLWAMFAPAILTAQDLSAMPEPPAPQKEHQWLQQFVGQWDSQSEGSMGPGQPPMKCRGTISTRSLGGLWVISDLETEAMGMTVSALQTIGYDPNTKKFVGTFIDSLFSHMWKYEGTVDAAGKVLTLEAEGPNLMAEGKLTKFRDIYEFKSPDQIAMTSTMLDDDGKWVTFMTGNAHRRK